MCFLTFFSFGLKFIWKRGIGHVGHHQSVGEPFTFSPRTLPSHLLLWTTCKYILANIFSTSFGQHVDIFWQILYFPSSFWTTRKYICANTIFSIFLLDNMQIYLGKYYIFHLPLRQNANIFCRYIPTCFGQHANILPFFRTTSK